MCTFAFTFFFYSCLVIVHLAVWSQIQMGQACSFSFFFVSAIKKSKFSIDAQERFVDPSILLCVGAAEHTRRRIHRGRLLVDADRQGDYSELN